MNITYKRQHSDSYMIIDTGLCDYGYPEKMIEENEISSLLPMTTMEMDGRSRFFYNISKKESLRDYLEGERVDKKLVQKILLYIHMGLEEVSNYLIDQSNIYISMDTVFLEKGNDGFKVYLCYNPWINDTVQTQLRAFFEWLVTVNPGDFHEVFDLSLKDDYTIMELIEALDEVEETYEEEIEVKQIILDEEGDYESSTNFLDDELDEKPKMNQLTNIISKLFSKEKEEKPDFNSKKNDFIIDPDMEITEPTVLLKPEDIKCTGKLIYDGDSFGDNYVISQDVFRVGNGAGNNAVLSSGTVSRHHAKIYKENGEYFLEDLNSTNGTYLNGKVCEYKNPKRLKPMDQIQFADVSYVFL